MNETADSRRRNGAAASDASNAAQALENYDWRPDFFKALV